MKKTGLPFESHILQWEEKKNWNKSKLKDKTQEKLQRFKDKTLI